MGYDKRRILRGQCSLCDCDEFESSGVRCDYCGHTLVDHLPLEPVTKGSSADNSLPKQDEVGEIQLHPADQPSSSKSTDNENTSKDIKIIDLECETPTGVQTISNDDASEKAVEMGVLHTDPDNTDNEVRSLQKWVDSLASDKEVFEIRRRNGKVVAFCNICMTTIATGEAHQGLFCIRQHMATQTHKTNLEITHSRESEILLVIQTLQREIDEQFLWQFVSRKKSVVCRTCNTELLLSHKATLNNTRQHINSTNQKVLRRYWKKSRYCLDFIRHYTVSTSSLFSRMFVLKREELSYQLVKTIQVKKYCSKQERHIISFSFII